MPAVPERNVEEEGPVERIEKAICGVNVLTVSAVYLERGGNDQLGSERHGRDHRRGGQRAVVVLAGGVHAPRAVATKQSPPAGVLDHDVSRSIAGGDSPDRGPVVAATTGVGDGIGALSVDRAPAVLEVVEAAPLHIRVADVAEIRPDMRVLVTEQRRKAQELLTEERAPLLV